MALLLHKTALVNFPMATTVPSIAKLVLKGNLKLGSNIFVNFVKGYI